MTLNSRAGFARTALVLSSLMLIAASRPQTSEERPDAPGEPGLFDEVPVERVRTVVAGLADASAPVRARARLELMNLPGSAYEAVKKAAGEEGLAAEAQTTLQLALPALEARSRILQRVERDQKALQLSLQSAYDAAGSRNPKWDDVVGSAFALIARPDPHKDAPQRAAALLVQLRPAIAADCDDALIGALHAQAELLQPKTDHRPDVDVHRASILKFCESRYPAAQKLWVLLRPSEADEEYLRKEALRLVTESLPQWAKADHSNEYIFEQVELAYHNMALEKGPEVAFNLLNPRYAGSRPADDPFPLTLKGIAFREIALDRYDRSPAGMEMSRRLFGDRLATARESLTSAWELDHTDARAAAEMIKVISETPNPDLLSSATWVDRSLAADPDHAEPCRDHLDNLVRSADSRALLLAFGHRCFDSENWRGRIGFVLLNAHEAAAWQSDDKLKYMKQPEVWADVKSTYDRFLELFPKSRVHLSRYANFACRADQWEDASRVFQQIGEDFDPTIFPSKAVYNFYRMKAAEQAKLNAGKAQARGIQ